MTDERVVLVVDTNAIPEHVGDDLASTLLDSVREYFADPNVMADYERWLVEYKRERAEKEVKRAG